jgi:hypothetical protein
MVHDCQSWWSVRDLPIGSRGDIGRKFAILLMSLAWLAGCFQLRPLHESVAWW